MILDSVTHLPPAARGQAVLAASHGGTYAAWYAARRGVAAVILHDAGIGRARAGVAGLDWLGARGVPAAAVGHDSARIGDGADMAARGSLSTVNAPARALGLEPGMGCAAALAILTKAGLPPAAVTEELGEARQELAPGVVGLDSNGLVGPLDIGRIIVTGSHGGLLGGRPETAVKAAVAGALYNDAGIGIDRAGVSRLPALAARGIPAATLSCFSAEIGDALSAWRDGIVSAVNAPAAARGARIGITTQEFVALLLEHP